MTPPKNLRVGPYNYKVVTGRIVTGDMGLCDAQACVIYIDNDKNEHFLVERDTVLHEVLHAILDVTGLASVIATEVDDKFEEKMVRPLATALLQFLRDNPKFVHYLLGA